MAVSLPDELFERAVVRLGGTRSALYAQALVSYLDSLQGVADDVTVALDRLYGDHDEQYRTDATAGRQLIDSGGWQW